MVTIRRLDNRGCHFVAIDTDKDTKIFDIDLKHGEMIFKTKSGAIKYQLRYNMTSVIVNPENKSKHRPYFEVCDSEEGQLYKVDIIPELNNIIGIRAEKSEVYVSKKGKGFMIYNEERKIVCIIDTIKKEYKVYYKTISEDEAVIYTIIADSVWFTKIFQDFKINYKTKFVNQNPKRPKMFEYSKVRRALIEESYQVK